MRSQSFLNSILLGMKGITATALLCFLGSATADTLNGIVVGISDGDTLTLIDRQNQKHKIRLQGIDAPEKKQAWGRRSAQNLAVLAFKKEATAECSKGDRYGRLVCKILIDGQDVNLAQIETGMAWWYRTYAGEQSPSDRATYETSEELAKAAHAGLWATPNPQPPWEWRRDRRVQSPR